ncbi:MAG TPA: amidohydrolase family protein [Micromonosporaceae bacterium]|nr:amidohydrolase family protein [Micromonosporaceae bacterium]
MSQPVGPAGDADVHDWARALGLPGLIDIHTHFLPPRMMRRGAPKSSACREAPCYSEHFAGGGPLIGRDWPITYRWPDEERIAHLRSMGVHHYSALAYAHRPDMAADLNDWTLSFADRTPDCIPSMTFYPETGVLSYVDDAIARGARIAKLHLQVGGFDPADARLDDVWARLADAGMPVVVHAGSGPVRAGYTGPEPFGAVLRRHPRLVAVIAHCGAPEYDGFFALARAYPRVCLDTTMVGTDFFNAMAPLPDALLPDFRELGRDGRVLLGSDFPNIPYPYADQLAALARFDLGDDWLRAVYWNNAAALLDLDPA